MRLSVLTINLRHELADDGPDNWPRRKHRTARLILDHSADLLGTQEGRQPQIRDLEQLIPDYVLSEAHRQWDPERMYPCLFYRSGRFNVLKSGDFWLSKTPHKHATKSWGSAFPRLATWALLQTIPEGIELYACVTHLDHISAEARLGQTGVLIDELDRIAGDKAPIILTGDFNDLPDSGAYLRLTGTEGRFRDVWADCKRPEEGFDTWHGFTGKGQRGRIDWVLVRGSVVVLNIRILRDTYEGRYPSDHFPVQADLEIETG